MKKLLSAILLLILIGVTLTGCTKDSSLFIGSVEVYDANLWYVRYTSFNGSEAHEAKLNGDGERSFSVEIETTSGNLALSITNEDGTVLYTGKEPLHQHSR